MSGSKSIILNLITDSPDYIFDNFMEHLPERQEVYASLIDEESRRTFCGYWLGKISYQLSPIVYANTLQYICQGFIPKTGDIVIDCGACDGNTAVRFMNLGCKVYAFEMDKLNYEITRQVASEKNFIVENVGLGSFKHETTYIHDENNIGASRLTQNGSNKTQIITLDSYVADNKLPRVDFIKMDVEGAELDVLRGAATTIARFKPILALSVYHKLDDFWTLTNFVKSIRPDYEFAMRQYAYTREDFPVCFKKDTEEFLDSFGVDLKMPSFAECVLFAR